MELKMKKIQKLYKNKQKKKWKKNWLIGKKSKKNMNTWLRSSIKLMLIKVEVLI